MPLHRSSPYRRLIRQFYKLPVRFIRGIIKRIQMGLSNRLEWRSIAIICTVNSSLQPGRFFYPTNVSCHSISSDQEKTNRRQTREIKPFILLDDASIPRCRSVLHPDRPNCNVYAFQSSLAPLHYRVVGHLFAIYLPFVCHLSMPYTLRATG